MRKFWLSPRIIGVVLPLLVGWGLDILGCTSPPVAYALFGIAFVWLVCAIIDWRKNKDKYGAIELQDLIGSVPSTLDALHGKRGLVTEAYVRKDTKYGDLKALGNMNIELHRFLGGRLLADTFANVEGGKEALALLKDSSPDIVAEFDTQKPEVQLSDYELGRLVANSAKTHLPIQTTLDRDRKYQKLNKSLKDAMDKLPNTMVVKATEAINYYLSYSQAYWAVATIFLYILGGVKTIEDKGVSLPKGTIDLVETAYNIYKDRFRKQMDIYKAKVCEVINDYTLQTWSREKKK